ncbi:hypothetical protein P9272_03250 [Mesorhizobium sp. WSM4976]|uniref:hypothetical protein n=1 Tax=Mesorhizobium sp. WSM4976 TaxID=3038549 RepID=UPI0024162A31|nr:hypothetical protein [Mesorhizobium sp. WSM4976]MDG4892613.1 hypothetical protein [Mesorhizobium sp. WSM4976]
MTVIAMDRPSTWPAGRMSDLDMADALGCEVAFIKGVTGSWSRQSLSTATAERTQGVQTCIRLAIAHALHTTGALTLSDAAAVAAGSWQVSASLLKLLEFRPRGCRPDEGDAEADPLMQFVPRAAEAIPIAAADEYLDVADGRRVYWRKPRRDAYLLACDLHRLSRASRREDTPALQEEYLELLARLREPEDHVCEWIGTVADGRFRPPPDRFAERSPAMRQGIADGRGRSFADSYATKVSVNVSLAARSMKRRALGLAVIDPLRTAASRKGDGKA